MSMLTVLMATHVGAGINFDRAVASVLADIDGARDAELLIVGDGITPQVPPSGHLRVVVTAAGGHANALNAGIEASRGQFVARMDHDDIWPIGRLADTRRNLTSQPDLYAGSIVKFGVRPPRYEPAPHSADAAYERLRHTGYAFAHPAVTFRKRAVEEVQGYDPNCDGTEDLDLWLRLFGSGAHYRSSRQVHLFYRMHTTQMSATGQSGVAQMRAALQRHPEEDRFCAFTDCPGRLRSFEAMHDQSPGSKLEICSSQRRVLGPRLTLRLPLPPIQRGAAVVLAGLRVANSRRVGTLAARRLLPQDGLEGPLTGPA